MIDTLCTVEDDFVIEQIRWVVELEDGTLVYQDDNRPGREPHSAWVRLGLYLQESKLNIVKYRFEFRTHKIHFPNNAEGYFFSKKAFNAAGFEDTDNPARKGLDYYLGGMLKEGQVWVAHFVVPELHFEEEDRREPMGLPHLIVNPKRLDGTVMPDNVGYVETE